MLCLHGYALFNSNRELEEWDANFHLHLMRSGRLVTLNRAFEQDTYSRGCCNGFCNQLQSAWGMNPDCVRRVFYDASFAFILPACPEWAGRLDRITGRDRLQHRWRRADASLSSSVAHATRFLVEHGFQTDTLPELHIPMQSVDATRHQTRCISTHLSEFEGIKWTLSRLQ